MGVYARKKFQTTPVQVVTEPSLESNSPTNVPTIEAVNKGLSARQLLINNDFQINQRGQSEYSSSEVKYTLDMWIKRGSVIKAVTNGIIFDTVDNESNGTLGQKVESIEVGKKYTVCINVVSIKGSGSMSIGTRAEFDNVTHSNNLKQGINKITFTATGKWLTVCCKDVEINIEYIDLFEGDIAYPHVKEDYNIALQRCEYYLRKCNFSVPQLYVYGSSSPNKRVYMITVPIYGEMKSIPTLVSGYITYYASSASRNALTITDLIVQYVDKNIINIKTPEVDEISSYSQGFRGSILLSCE